MIFQPRFFKRCSRCNQYLPATTRNFARTKSFTFGLFSVCKPCCRENYAANAEMYRTRKNESRRKHVDAVRAARRARYHANPEKERQATRQWREKHLDQAKAACAKWFKEHPEKRAVYDQQKRERKLKAEGAFTAKDVLHQYNIQQGHCYWCSQLVDSTYHVDHIIPLSRGGTNWPANLAIACEHCNLSKGPKLPFEEWMPPNPLYK